MRRRGPLSGDENDVVKAVREYPTTTMRFVSAWSDRGATQAPIAGVVSVCFAWEEEEYYCLEHWARWLRWGLASHVDCEQWVEWADGVLDALVVPWRQKVVQKNTMCQ